MVRFVVALLAIATVTVQVQILGAWPFFGSTPHLIAAGLIVFAMLEKYELGLVWLITGGLVLDGLLSVRFGTTTLPLLFGYGALILALRRVIHDVPVWGYALLAAGLVACAESVIALRVGAWGQWVRDAVAAGVLVFPAVLAVSHATSMKRAGLRL